MPSDAISISPETAKQLDSTALLRRLLQKGNMQMRPVTLPEGWHKKDMGVFIGFYSPPGGRERTLSALLPDTPKSYRIVTREHPEGIPLTDGEEKHLARDDCSSAGTHRDQSHGSGHLHRPLHSHPAHRHPHRKRNRGSPVGTADDTSRQFLSEVHRRGTGQSHECHRHGEKPCLGCLRRINPWLPLLLLEHLPHVLLQPEADSCRHCCLGGLCHTHP